MFAIETIYLNILKNYRNAYLRSKFFLITL